MEVVYGVLVLLVLIAIIYKISKGNILQGTWSDGQVEIVITKNSDGYIINGVNYKLITVGQDSVLYDENRNSIPFKFIGNKLILGFGTTNQFILTKN